MKRATTLFFSLLISFSLFGQVDDCVKINQFRVLVIGSSTAAGAGASTPDSAWVNRYRAHLQSINPANEVINLAVGGYNTYRLMPSDNVPPNGRPLPDTLRNITAALAQSPDGIIINLPSNDAASGWTAEEQLNNFETIYQTAKAADVPIWICTTQPRNFGQSMVDVQLIVRDSINARYGDFALDFWSGTAAPDNQLDSLYDSGDGVHLNDWGHRLLFEVVKKKELLAYLVTEKLQPDFGVTKFSQVNGFTCSDAEIELELVIANFGITDADSLQIEFAYRGDTLTGNFSNQFAAPSACQSDTFYFTIPNASSAGIGRLRYSLDSNSANDFFDGNFEVLPAPFLPDFDKIGLCAPEQILLELNVWDGDHLFWYANLTDEVPIDTGTFLLPLINSDTTFYAQAVNGELFYKNSLFTTDQFNRDWNGFMFDLTANEDIFVDSLSVNMFSSGTQLMEIYLKNGSLQGAELDSSQWQLYQVDTLQVAQSGEYVMLKNLNLSLSANDTLAVYLQLQDPAADMNYMAPNENVASSDDIITMTNGTGISHDFSEVYFPRLFSGEVFYHYGTRWEGDCSTERIPLEIELSQPVVNLGADTSLMPGDILVLNAGDNFTSYSWSTGETTQTIAINFDDLTDIETTFFVLTENIFGCIAADTIIISRQTVSVDETQQLNYALSPNPGNGTYLLKGHSAKAEIEVFNALGQQFYKNEIRTPARFDWTNFNEGQYFLKISKENRTQVIPFYHMK